MFWIDSKYSQVKYIAKNDMNYNGFDSPGDWRDTTQRRRRRRHYTKEEEEETLHAKNDMNYNGIDSTWKLRRRLYTKEEEETLQWVWFPLEMDSARFRANFPQTSEVANFSTPTRGLCGVISVPNVFVMCFSQLLRGGRAVALSVHFVHGFSRSLLTL